MNQQNAIPPTAHCSSTVAASRRDHTREGTDASAAAANDDRSTYPDPPMPGDLLRSSRRLVGFGVAIVVAVGLSGCFTGERPTLAEAPTMTGDPATDAVLQRLDTRQRRRRSAATTTC